MGLSIRIVFHANFRELAGKKETTEDVPPGSRLSEILDSLAQRYGGDFKRVVDPDTDQVSQEYLVSINGWIVRDKDTVINDNDTIVLTIPVGGG